MCTPSPVREGTEKRLTENWIGGMNIEGGGRRERRARNAERWGDGRWPLRVLEMVTFADPPLWLMLEQDVWLRKQGQEGRVLPTVYAPDTPETDGWMGEGKARN